MCLTPWNITLSTHAHPLLQIQIHVCPVGTCQIHLPNATAHKPPESGGRAGEGTWVTEGLHSWNKCSPGSEGLWHKGQWCFPRMRTVRLQKDLSLLHHIPPAEPPLSDQAQVWTKTNYTECSCKAKATTSAAQTALKLHLDMKTPSYSSLSRKNCTTSFPVQINLE